MATHATPLPADVLALQGQVEELQSLVAELQARLAAEAERGRHLALLSALIDEMPTPVYASSPDGRYLVVNRVAGALFGREASEMLGRPFSELVPAAQAAAWLSVHGQAVATGLPVSQESQIELADGAHTFSSTLFPVHDADGAVLALGGISGDITALRRSDQERERLQEQIIEAQAAALAELSTPLIPLSQDVVVMPLIGTLDSRRAQQVLETLLEGIAATQAGTAILDITGVPVVDTQVANALIRAAQAVKLLGAQVVLTGIRPEVAQTLVGLGADLSSITTCGSLQAGIAFAMTTA